ncbi:MAG: HAMP domain-containing histidine kinase [Lachnospiraceae bacterium]|nr:HAMP domain-containing histidine kinase [Lachnospiraceae bacterium]
MPLSKKKKERKFAQISQKILFQYFASLFGLIGIGLGGFYIAKFICSRKVWYNYDPLYATLKELEFYFPKAFTILVFVWILILTLCALKKAFGYMDETVEAAKNLSHPEVPITLSEEMIDIQNELNLARERSLRNIAVAKEAEQRKNDLIVYLAHDLKTPLTSVIGYLTLLQDEPQLSPELRERYTGIALEKAERLEGLINEFFDITRFNLTTLTLEAERTNLSRMLEQITYEFNPILGEKELTWNMNITPEVEILCDRDKMERVFDNLIRNAVNYSYSGTEISLSMQSLGEEVEIVVKNHGKTIPPDKLNRIFEQFFRLDSSRSSSTGGSGLGLAISKEIVELHGGRIQAKSENESIIFQLFLPKDCYKIVRISE